MAKTYRGLYIMMGIHTTRIMAATACLGLTLMTASAFAAEDRKVTFTKDVAPIFVKNCLMCHRPKDIAPMSLRSYDEVRPWVKSIRENVVEKRTMPPWHSDMPEGYFENDRRLAEEDVETIKIWIDQGAKKGSPRDMPSIPEMPESWRLGTPDVIVEYQAVNIPAEGSDININIFSVPDIDEDKWVSAIEFLPSDRRVVHHSIALTPDAAQAAATTNGLAGWLGGWAAGTDPMVFPHQSARKIKKGEAIMLNMHYHPYGEETTDTMRLGLHFTDQPQPKENVNLWIMDTAFAIPAGAPNHEVRASHVLEQDVHVVSVLPHMHYRGKDMSFMMTFPDGTQQLLCNNPDYDFAWQTCYNLTEPLFVPKGTRIDVLAHFDNSTDNEANPDPTKIVRFGPQSFDEMMIGMIDYIAVDKEGDRAGR